MVDTSDLLKLLADGQFHSGEELAQATGVSRTAVWKHLKKLETWGLEIYSVPGKGYRLDESLELLDRRIVETHLLSEVVPLVSKLEILCRVESTNQQIMNQAEGLPSGYICLAEQQTAGKGRRGRHWISPFGHNLYLSLLWHFSSGVSALEGLSLAVGVGVIRALEGLGAQGLQLKWPNDIVYRQQKLGGILIEMTGDVAGNCQVVVGVGINISMPKEIAEPIDQNWTDLGSTVARILSRNLVAAACINQLLPLLHQYEKTSFVAYKPDWELKDAFRGQLVQLIMGDKSVSGIALGVDDTGGIRIQETTGIRTYHGGEISLRVLS